MLLTQQKIRWLCLVLVVVVLDQISKHYAAGSLNYGEPQSFLPYFNFTLLHNPGAAFSFLSDEGGWQRWLLGLIALVVSVFLLVWILRADPKRKIELTALSLILGGAIGNLIDRIALGYVIDFIDWFYYGMDECLMLFYSRSELQTCHWPTFNIADAAIFLGAGFLIYDVIFSPDGKVEGESE